MAWTLTNCEFFHRLQQLWVYTIDTGKASSVPWHDAMWRNALAKAAVKDGATVLHHMEIAQVHDGDWVRLLLACPYRWVLEDNNTTAAVVMQDSADRRTTSLTVVSWWWERMGGWDESHVVSYVEDMVLRCKACGKLGYVMDEDVVNSTVGTDNEDADDDVLVH